jgi:GTP-binding protein HflX
MLYSTETRKPRALLVGVPTQEISDQENQESLQELARLADTLGFDVVGNMTQRRRSLTGKTILGEGKLMELAKRTGGTGKIERHKPKKRKAKLTQDVPDEEEAEEIEDSWDSWDEEDDDLEQDDSDSQESESESESSESNKKEPVDAVVVDCELTPSQLANLQSATGVEVLDRTGVIVEIFSRHAKTREAKLQVEIARLKYLAPRIRKAGTGPSDRRGKAGESAIELDRRNIRDRISELKLEIEKVQQEQSTHRTRRSEQPSVALVGYTNAGKSSLMRALTGSEVLVEDKLFATLGTTVRALTGDELPRILVSDTVGFIKKLPHDLVASFRSTLEEAKNAWLLLFVVDASDPAFRTQLKVTQEVLKSLGLGQPTETDEKMPEPAVDIPSMLVLNKSDRLSLEQQRDLAIEFPDAQMLSAKSPEDVQAFRQLLLDFFRSDMPEEELFVPYSAAKVLGTIRSSVNVLDEQHEEAGYRFRLRGEKKDLERIKQQLIELTT